MSVYTVRTQENTFNSIESLEHLIRVRTTMHDFSPTMDVCEWVEGEGWKRINPDEMREV